MDLNEDVELWGIITRLAQQVNQIAKNQQQMFLKLPHLSKQHKISVRFPSPSIIESSPLESPFIFPMDIPNRMQEMEQIVVPRNFFPSIQPLDPANTKILIVEDDFVCQQLLVKILRRTTTGITVVENGMDALHVLQKSHYDLVLMDIQMPVMDGMAATRAIRKFDGTTPIVSVTASCSPEELCLYRSAGMNDCLSKPFSSDDLCSLFQKYCCVERMH